MVEFDWQMEIPTGLTLDLWYRKSVRSINIYLGTAHICNVRCGRSNQTTINWTAWGDQSVERANTFAYGIALAVGLAKDMDNHHYVIQARDAALRQEAEEEAHRNCIDM